MRKMLCASMAALGIDAGPAVAADLSVAPIYKAAPAPVPTWTGSYVGISGGGAWGSAVVHNDTTGVDQTPRFDLSGAIVGVTTGLQVQNGNLVIGYEGDTSITSKKGSAFEFPPNVGFSNEVKRALAVDLPRPRRRDPEQYLAVLRHRRCCIGQCRAHDHLARGHCHRGEELALGLDRGRRRRGQDQPRLVGEDGISLRRFAGQVVLQSGADRRLPEQPAGALRRPRSCAWA